MGMIIDLELLDSNDYLIEEEFSFPKEYTHPDIKGLDSIFIKGIISKDDYSTIHLDLTITGRMLLEDAISLEDVFYDFLAKIDEDLEENTKNNTKTIDIIDILWQNIILEIPLRYTEVKDYKDFQGDGWKLISEEERVNSNNPFKALIENKKEE